MDSITHIALGACAGTLLAGRPLRRKAWAWGAAAQSIPDIDFLAGLWSSPAEDLLAHRGFTHSLLFVLLGTPLLALVAARLHQKLSYSLRQWGLFFSLQLILHLLLDALNVYGTGWWEPFGHYRVSCNLLFVADPIFTLPLLWAAAVLFFKFRKKESFTYRSVYIAFIFCSMYLMLALYNKYSMDKKVKEFCLQKGIGASPYFTTPAPFTSLLWYCVVAAKGGFYIGYWSIFEEDSGLSLQYVAQQDSLLSAIHQREDVQHLIRFSKGYYAVQHREGQLVFNDLRFGQQGGWQNPKAPFSFYYFLEHPGQNDFLIQRGRIAGWNYSSFIHYLRRIGGKTSYP